MANWTWRIVAIQCFFQTFRGYKKWLAGVIKNVSIVHQKSISSVATEIYGGYGLTYCNKFIMKILLPPGLLEMVRRHQAPYHGMLSHTHHKLQRGYWRFEVGIETSESNFSLQRSGVPWTIYGSDLCD